MAYNQKILNSIVLHDSTSVTLPASKSINNRALIISNLAGGSTILENPSNARDSELMRNLISSDHKIIDAQDAGTTFRFLTAYLTIKDKIVTLTGSDRMKQRPIGLLVDALRNLGGDIAYINKEGYPPLKIEGFTGNHVDHISIPGNISSQYISAVLMIAPLLGKELTIELTGKVGSWPYILMTLNIMKDFGAEYKVEGEQIKISNIPYSAIDKFWVESDWSAASYWYSIVSLSKSGSVFLPGLNKDSMQGDSAIAKIMQPLGVNTEFSEKGVSLQRIPDESSHLEWDFTDCPDLAQTVAVICAAKGVKCKMTGLESLRIKETDRINALQTELAKFNVDFKEVERSWIIDNQINPSLIPVEIDTYEDHRMAMAFAPISILCPIIINDPEVVEKSYPHFWDDIENSTSGSSS